MFGWEDIYKDILNTEGNGKDKLLHYFENKTTGYNSQGKIQKLFSIKKI